MDIIKRVQDYIDRLHSPEQFIKKQEIYAHLYGVANFCTILAIKRNLDPELATIIGLLHDISTYKTEYTIDHAERGAKLAYDILKEMNIIDDNKINIVCKAIKMHSNKLEINSQYDELIKDADTLNHCLFNINESVIEKEKKRYEILKCELALK